MKILFISETSDLVRDASLILKIRWPDLNSLHAAEAREGIELIYRERPDIVMLQYDKNDEMSVDFLCLIEQIRSFSNVPLIVLSRSDDAMDKVRALEMGADDWIARSYSSMEYIAKVNAIYRRWRPQRVCCVCHFLDGKLSIDYCTREVYVNGNTIKLTPIEYKILCHLVKNEGSVVSQTSLLHSAWGPNYGDNLEFLKKYIYRLRSKIEENPADPEIIHTARGAGYVLTSQSHSIR